MYKRLNPDVDVEALNWRVIVAGPRPTHSGAAGGRSASPERGDAQGRTPGLFS